MPGIFFLRDAADAQSNADGDSLSNLAEFQQGRHPLINDDPPVEPLTLAGSAPSGVVGEGYHAAFTANGGTPGYTYSLSYGTLPVGLSLDGSTGLLSGTPTVAGLFDFSVNVADSGGRNTSMSYRVIITGGGGGGDGGETTTGPALTITTNLAVGVANCGYSTRIAAANGTAPYTFAIVGTGLPFGFQLSADGTLSSDPVSTGPQLPGIYTFTVRVDDSAGRTATRQFTLQLTQDTTVINTTGGNGTNTGAENNGGNAGQAEKPTGGQINTTSINGTEGSPLSIEISAKGGVLPYQFDCSYLPPGLSIDSETGIIYGTPTSPFDGNVTITITDGSGATITQPAKLKISKAPEEQGGTNTNTCEGSNNDPLTENNGTGEEEEEEEEEEQQQASDPKVTTVSFKAVPSGAVNQDKNEPIILSPDEPGSAYNEPHWEGDATSGSPPSKNSPVAYVAGGQAYVEVTFNVGSSGAQNTSGQKRPWIKLAAGSTRKLSFPPNWQKDYVEIPENSGGKVTVLLKAFDDEVGLYDADKKDKEFTLNWLIQRPGDSGFQDAGTTKHTVYVVRQKPVTAQRHETLFNIGCRKAIGMETKEPEIDVVDAIYSEFITRKVARVDPSSVKLKQESMTYWDSDSGSGNGTTGLLQTGDAKCGSWASLFRDVLGAQGINADIVEITPKNVDFNGYRNDYPKDAPAKPFELDPKGVMFVKNWTPKGSDPDNKLSPFYPVDLPGEPAQGQNNSDPFSVFRNHAVVKLTSSENYYDPSYGTPKFKTLKEWENRSLAGTGVMFGENSNRAWGRKIMSPKSTTFFFVWFGPVNNPNEEDCIWKIFK